MTGTLVGGFVARPSIAFTRPADTTAYASGDLVANSTTTTSVVPIQFPICRYSGNGGMLRRCRVKKSGNSITNASFRLHLFGQNPLITTTITVTIANPGVVTWASHGIYTGCPVVFSTTGALPTGITAGTTYYAIAVDTNTFTIASSIANAYAGTTITTSGTQSGTHTGFAGIGGGDNSAMFSTTPLIGWSHYYVGKLDITIDQQFADGAQGNGVPYTGSEINFTADTYYGLLEARAAYTPISGEVFTVELEVLQN